MVLEVPIFHLCAGVDGAAVSGPPAVRGCSQLSLDGRLALPDDAGLSHSHRPEHAAGGEGPLQGNALFCLLFICTALLPFVSYTQLWADVIHFLYWIFGRDTVSSHFYKKSDDGDLFNGTKVNMFDLKVQQ